MLWRRNPKYHICPIFSEWKLKNCSFFSFSATEVLNFIGTKNVPELEKAIVDADIAPAVEQSYEILADFVLDKGITNIPCVQTVAIAGMFYRLDCL